MKKLEKFHQITLCAHSNFTLLNWYISEKKDTILLSSSFWSSTRRSSVRLHDLRIEIVISQHHLITWTPYLWKYFCVSLIVFLTFLVCVLVIIGTVTFPAWSVSLITMLRWFIRFRKYVHSLILLLKIDLFVWFLIWNIYVTN